MVNSIHWYLDTRLCGWLAYVWDVFYYAQEMPFCRNALASNVPTLIPFTEQTSRRLTLTYLQSGGGRRSFRTHAQRLISDTAAILCTSGSSHCDQTSIDSDIISVHWGINMSVNWTTQPKSITTWWRAPAWRRSITSTWGWGSCRKNITWSAQSTSFLT